MEIGKRIREYVLEPEEIPMTEEPPKEPNPKKEPERVPAYDIHSH